MKRCKVCGREYAGWRCQCRKTQHSQARKRRGSASRRKATATAAQVLTHGFMTYSDPDTAIEVTVELCFKCGTQLGYGNCPACMARWQEECARADIHLLTPREWQITYEGDWEAPVILGAEKSPVIQPRPDALD